MILKLYGEEAVPIAGRLADALLGRGDIEDFIAWMGVAATVTNLERRALNKVGPVQWTRDHINAKSDGSSDVGR